MTTDRPKLPVTLAGIAALLECERIALVDSDGEILGCCAADLMSDVLANPSPYAILLTGLSNVQSVRTAALSDLRAIIYVRGKRPAPEAIELAEDEGIPLLATRMSMFEACGRLYQLGLNAGSADQEG